VAGQRRRLEHERVRARVLVRRRIADGPSAGLSGVVRGLTGGPPLRRDRRPPALLRPVAPERAPRHGGAPRARRPRHVGLRRPLPADAGRHRHRQPRVDVRAVVGPTRPWCN